MAVTYEEAPGIPTVGSRDSGSFIRNNLAPVMLGEPGARYYVFGWVKSTTGNANVAGVDWQECRSVVDVTP